MLSADEISKLQTCRDTIDTILTGTATSNAIASKSKQPKSLWDLLPDLRKNCRLFSEFDRGELIRPEMDAKEKQDLLAGVAMTLCNVPEGDSYFLKKTEEFNSIYQSSLSFSWADQIGYFQKHGFYPTGCDKFCPYSSCCSHQKNMLTTAGAH